MEINGKVYLMFEQSGTFKQEFMHKFYMMIFKLFHVCTMKGLRMVVENPNATAHYLHLNFPYEPSVIDKDRTRRGDYYKKPTMYYFHNCEPTWGMSFTRPKEKKTVVGSKSAIRAGLCSEERSMISPDYARNFICDFVLGKKQTNTLPDLFM